MPVSSQWFANPGVTYEIDQSIRFNDDDSAYLNRTPGSAGNRRTWTFSCWVKRGNITGANGPIFTAGADDWLQFLSGNTLGFNSDGSSNYRIVTSQLFRDPAAWFHVVLRIDTTNSTAGDRERMYINGSEVTDFGADTNPPLNYDTAFNNTGEHSIGKTVGSSQFFDGYLAEMHHVDGSSLAPSSFGETNDDGVWVPKAYSGSYGTTGFYLKGQDSSALGDDTSGNGSDFSSNNLAAADQMSDSPTNNHCTLNPLITPATMTFADGNLALSGYTASTSAYGTFGLSSGKWFWQIVAQANAMAGISATPNGSQYPGQAADSYAMDLTNGTKYNNGSSATYGSGEITAGDVIGVGFDADAGTLKFYDSDGNDIGTAYSSLTSGPYFPVFRNGNSANISINFGQTGAFTFTPTGYKALNTSNLSTPTIADPSAHFQTSLYTSDTSGQSITFDGNSDLAPDFLWFKRRDGASNNFLFDKVRGVNKGILSDATTVETTYTNSLTAFGTDGYTLGDGGSSNDINGVSGGTYVAWGWAAGGTSGSTNDDGSVDSTVTANTTAGFSICKFNPGGNSNITFAHGLGVAPRLVIVKNLEDATNWQVLHLDQGVGNKLFLNTGAAAASDANMWQNTAPSSTVVSVGTAQTSNHQNIAYCFAEIEGFSSFTKYEGNGSADGPMVHLGHRSSLVVIKRIDAVNDWVIWDDQRNTGNPNGTVLRWDSSNAEYTGISDRGIDILSNGIKIRTSNAIANASGGDYVVMSWAHSPFKSALAR